MRSRPDVTLYLDPATVTPGQRLRARVRLESRSATPIDGVEVVLTGRESRYKNTSSTGKSSVTYYHRRDVCRLVARFPAGVLEPGRWEREAIFDLPADAPPTFRSRLSAIAYELKVHVQIPWWPDRTVKYDVPVVPEAARPDPARPQTFTSQVGDYRGEDPVVELSIEDDQLFPGGNLRGAVAVTGLGSRRVRRVELVAATLESPRVYSAAGPTDVDRRRWVVREGRPDEGQAIAFNVGVPKDLALPFSSPFIQVDHWLEARVVVAFGRDVLLRAPIRVRRLASATPRSDAPIAPPVGRDRQRAVWAAAIERASAAGLDAPQFDPVRERATFRVSGIDVAIAEEQRESLGPCLVASLDWPSIGLGLRVAERRWTDFGGSPEGVHAALAKRFSVRTRDARQVRGLLDEGLFKALAQFKEAALDDDGAVVLRKGGVNQLAGLERVLAAVRALAETLAVRFGSIPAPQPLEGSMDAWRRFASERGARVRPGDGSVQDWSIRGIPVVLEYQWNDAEPVALRLTTLVPEGEDVTAWTTRFAADLSLEAFAEGRNAGVTMPLEHGPDRVAVVAERMTATVAKLLGHGAEGPYR